jgi:sugar phosphate permease
LSNVIAGWIVQFGGYSAGFLFLAAVAMIGALVFGLLMPETAPKLQRNGDAGGADLRSSPA